MIKIKDITARYYRYLYYHYNGNHEKIEGAMLNVLSRLKKREKTYKRKNKLLLDSIANIQMRGRV